MKENDVIRSAANPRVKRLRKLMKSAEERETAGVFPVEGIRMVREAPPELIRELYLTESAAADPKCAGLPCREEAVIVSDEVFRSISDTKTPQGILALVMKQQYSLADVMRTGRPVILLEELQDPGNMGTILRSLEAAGGGGVICDGRCADIYSLKTLRSTMGAVFRVPHVTVPDLKDAAAALKANGYTVYAAHLGGKADLYDIRFQDKAAFMIGNEGRGLSEEAAGLADVLLRIPMEGSVESLNASVAASLLVYEVKRQNR